MLLIEITYLCYNLLSLQGHPIVTLEIKQTTRLKKLLQVYCNRQGLQMGSVWFMHGWNIVHPEKIPAQVNVCAFI